MITTKTTKILLISNIQKLTKHVILGSLDIQTFSGNESDNN